MTSKGLKQVWSKLFKSGHFGPDNLVFKSSARAICEQEHSKNEGKDGSHHTTCFEQVKALHDRETHPVSHVILDLDGVVLDSNYYNTMAHEEYLMKWKKALRPLTKYRIMGMRNVDAGKIVTDEYDMPFDGKVYAHGVWQIQRDLLHRAKIVRGIDDVVCYFIKQKMPIALISSSHEKAMQILHGRLKGFDKYFCHIVHGDDVVNGKPDPEILIKAAKLFQGGPKETIRYLVIDGSYSGALASRAAGMQVIMVADPHMPKQMHEAANVVINDIRKFDPTEFHLPEMKKMARR